MKTIITFLLVAFWLVPVEAQQRPSETQNRSHDAPLVMELNSFNKGNAIKPETGSGDRNAGSDQRPGAFLPDYSAEKLEKLMELHNAREQEAVAEAPVLQLAAPSLSSPVRNSFPIDPLSWTNNLTEDTGQWIFWGSGQQDNALGSFAPMDWNVAQRFSPADLAGFEGFVLSKVRFFPADPADFTIRVWQGNNPPSMVYEQEVTSYNLNEMNTVELIQPVNINVNEDLWVGYRFVADPDGSSLFPAAIDGENSVAGKGDMIQLVEGSSWESLFLNYGIPGNWIIQGFVEPGVDNDAPAAPENLSATPGAQGALEAFISWNNPSLTFGGETLNELDIISIFRNGELIHTISDPTPGALTTFTDTQVEDNGILVYSVNGENQWGPGALASINIFVGEDVPAAPENVLLTATESDALITWEAPVEGLNGGYLSDDNIDYIVVRFPGNVIVAQGLTELSFQDTNIPSAGNYFYRVTASNHIGIGGTAQSNTALLGSDNIVFFETFDYPVGSIPEEWTLQGVPHGWSVNSSAQAGGTAPELRLNFSPSISGTSRMISYPFSVEGGTELSLSFKQKLVNFEGFDNDVVAVDVSFDDGSTWNTVWETVVNSNIPAGEYNAYFQVPSGINEMVIAFRFSGNTWNINEWYIDDVIVQYVLDNDLAAKAIIGNQNAIAGAENSYTIRVKNTGANTQSDYIVRLMKNDGEEIASLPGNLIAFNEVQDYAFTWIPDENELGPVTLYGLIDFPADENPSNNATPVLQVTVVSAGSVIVSIGDGNTLFGMPYDFFWDHSLSQTIYYSEEIGLSAGFITDLKYYFSFTADYLNKHIMIWLGETDQADLTGGWIDPSTLQLVFDGNLDFFKDDGEILISLDTPYVYNGENLVIYSLKTDTQWSSGKNFLNTLDGGSSRSRRAQRDSTPFDPANPDVSGETVSAFPNISIYINTEGLASLQGTVTDGSNPLQDVEVQIVGTINQVLTDENGFYEFPVIQPGLFDISFNKFGYESLVVEDVLIEGDMINELNAALTEIPSFLVTGIVSGNDGLLVEGASVMLTGYDEYITETNESGSFSFPSVYQGMYEIRVIADGYDLFVDDELSVESDIVLEITLTQSLANPFALKVELDDQNPGNALLSWNSGIEREFRYDSGTPSTSLGAFDTNSNSVMGAVHRNSAILNDMSWWIPFDSSFPMPEQINVWVFGLDESGEPNPDDVLYSQSDIPIAFNEWNTYTFSHPVDAPSGFLVGIGAENYIILAMDTGDDPGWPFIPNTQYVNFDVTTQGFSTIESFGFPWNFFIRANGLDLGSLDFDQKTNPLAIADGFNIYLNDMEEAIAFTEEIEYLFTGLDEGTYTAGVQAVYTTGLSEIVTIDFEMIYPVDITINLTTNSGVSPEGAIASLTGNSDNQLIYTGEADENGTIVMNFVRKSTYTLEISLENHQTYVDENLVIDDDLILDVELLEATDEPFNLTVLTEGLEAGQALFTWNNPTHGWAETFDSGQLPEGWTQIVTNTGTNAGLPATWHITGVVPFSTNSVVPKSGDYQAFMMWSFQHQDEWLITPEFTAPAGDLTFWYHGVNGSTFGDNYYVKISNDGGNSWDILWNASQLPPGNNFYQAPAVIDLTHYAGQDVRIAWRNEDGPGNFGMWYMWAVDNISVGDLDIDVKDLLVVSSPNAENISGASPLGSGPANSISGNSKAGNSQLAVNGFNVFLNGNLMATGISDTQFLFSQLADGEYTAGVQAIYSTGTSEIVEIDFVVHDTRLLALVAQPAGSGMLQGSAWYPAGAEVFINAIPNEGFIFLNWTDTQGTVVSEQPAFFFTMPDNDVILIANFDEFETFALTFNIDMTNADWMDMDHEVVNITGSMHNWAVIGDIARDQALMRVDNSHIFTITFHLPPDVYAYAYFLNEGEHDHEWEDVPLREIVLDGDKVVNDAWGLPTNIETLQPETILVYPNPFTDRLHVRGADWATHISITDIMGNTIMDMPFTGETIGTGHLRTGMYLLRLRGENGRTAVHKILKY